MKIIKVEANDQSIIRRTNEFCKKNHEFSNMKICIEAVDVVNVDA